MSNTVTCKCANKVCGKLFEARPADRARGWARFCSKSCKAVVQEGRTHTFRSYLKNTTPCEFEESDFARHVIEDGWDGHKNAY